MTDKQLLEQALKALENAQGYIESEHDDRKSLYEPYGMDYKYSTEAEDLYRNKEAITAIRERLEQPEQEPVAYVVWGENNIPTLTFSKPAEKYVFDALYYTTPPAAPVQEPVAIHQFRSPHSSDWYDGIPDHHDGHGPYEVRTLYIATPAAQRQWVGLTDEEIKPLCDENYIIYGAYTVDFIQSIEAKLKEKNNG